MTLLNGTSINEILHKKEYEIREGAKEEGKKEGIEITKEKLANNMIKEGLPISQISRISELDVDSLHQLTLGK